MIKVCVQNKMEIWVHSNLRPKQECGEGKAESDFPPLALAPTSTCEAQNQPHTETPLGTFPCTTGKLNLAWVPLSLPQSSSLLHICESGPGSLPSSEQETQL